MDAAHLFLACAAEVLQILHSHAPATAATGPADQRALETLRTRTRIISDYEARSPEDILLKSQILAALIEARMSEHYPELAQSLLADMRAQYAQAGPKAPTSSLTPGHADAILELVVGQTRRRVMRPGAAPAGADEITPGDIKVQISEVDLLVQEMVATARRAMLPPTQLTLFSGPLASFCTAAALIARVERVLKCEFHLSWPGLRVAIFGAGGIVGNAAANIAALEGADVRIAAHRQIDRLHQAAAQSKARFGVELAPVRAETPDQVRAIVCDADVVLCAAAPATNVVTAATLAAAGDLRVIADTNLVPPAGVEGIGAHMDGARLPFGKALGIGPFTVGSLRHRTESYLLMQMVAAKEPRSLNFRDVLMLAKKLAS